MCPAGCGAHAFTPNKWNVRLGDKPTASPSYLVRSERKGKPYVCHSVLRNGVIEFLSDCSHEFAGKQYTLQPGDILFP